jgi:mediator of RNA polymerase II transcription subunit 21
MTQMDVVTEAQQQLSVLCSHFYATIGSLQRDAPAVSVKNEPLIRSAGLLQTPITQQTQTMAQQVVQSSKQLEKLIMQLPDRIESEQQQLETLQELQQQHLQAGVALDMALREAHNCLIQVQDCFADIADSHLQCNGA